MLAYQPGVITRAVAEGSDDSSTGIMIVLMFYCYDSEGLQGRARVLGRFPESNLYIALGHAENLYRIITLPFSTLTTPRWCIAQVHPPSKLETWLRESRV